MSAEARNRAGSTIGRFRLFPKRASWLAALPALLLATFAMSASAAAPPRPVHLTQATITVSAQNGYSLPAPDHAPPIVAGTWRSVDLPNVTRPALAVGVPAAVADAWYRLRLDAPTVPDQATYLYIPRWQTTGYIAIYADGRLIYAPRSGPRWNSFNLPVWVEIARPSTPPPREILIRLQAGGGAAFALSSVWVGPQDALSFRHGARRLLQIDAPEWGCAIFMVVGAVTLLLWINRRKEPAYLLLFGVAATLSLHSIEYFVGLDPVPIPEPWMDWIEGNMGVWYGSLTFVMASFYIGGPSVWMRRVAVVFLATFSASTAAMAVLNLSLPKVQFLIWGIGLGVNLAGVVVAWLGFRAAKSRIGFLFCVFNSLIFPASMIDILTSRLILSVEGVYLLPLVPIVQSALFLYIFSVRHLDALDEAEQAQGRLALRLNEREAELAQTYERLHESERRRMIVGERQRLMRDMHDGVGSSLISAIAVVERGEIDPRETAQILRDCLDDLKLAIDSLEPVDSDLLLLLATARYRLEPRFEQAGVKLVWTVGELPPLPKIPPEHALHILRIVQEVFTNVVKHAGAREVRLTVEARGEGVAIDIVDDGVGFDVDRAVSALQRRRHRGLSNLKARAAAIGAAIQWTSAPGFTCVTISMSLVAASA